MLGLQMNNLIRQWALYGGSAAVSWGAEANAY